MQPTILIDPTTGATDTFNGGEIPDGAHKVDITGVTEDGRFIVSSYGKEYYLDPDSDFQTLDFQKITYG
jgi:hypothetical protein